TPGGMALEVYRGVDSFGRLDENGRATVAQEIRTALDGGMPLRERLEERIRRYDADRRSRNDTVRVAFDLGASSSATVVEVHARDEVALLSRVAAVFADLDLD